MPFNGGKLNSERQWTSCVESGLRVESGIYCVGKAGLNDGIWEKESKVFQMKGEDKKSILDDEEKNEGEEEENGKEERKRRGR